MSPASLKYWPEGHLAHRHLWMGYPAEEGSEGIFMYDIMVSEFWPNAWTIRKACYRGFSDPSDDFPSCLDGKL